MSSDDGQMIVLKEQIVTKRTMCANCIHFDADSTKLLEEWRPLKEADEQRVLSAVRFAGLELDGFSRGDVGLQVAQATRTGMSVEEAIRHVEQKQLQQAHEQVGEGEELWKADVRYKTIRATEEGIKSGKIGKCRGPGVDRDDNPIGDRLLFSAYHCHQWSARAGASLAHDGQPLDPLPAELIERATDKAKKAQD